MRTAQCFDSLWSAGQPAPLAEFHIAVVFDSPDRGARALRVCSRLIERFTGDFLFNVALCDVHSFKDAAQCAASVRRAMRASLIVLATDAAPPSDFWSWLNNWAAAPREHRAGVATLTEGTASSDLIEAELKRRCKAWDVDLIRPETETITRSGGGTGEHARPPHEPATPQEDAPERGRPTS